MEERDARCARPDGLRAPGVGAVVVLRCVVVAGAIAAGLAGQARFAKLDRAPAIPPGTTVQVIMRAVDVNGDGAADLVTSRGTEVSVWLGDGRGSYTESYASRLAGASDVEAADFDGDGNLDLLWTNDLLHLALGDGAGGFVEAPRAFPTLPRISQLAIDDVDLDGDVDVFGCDQTVVKLLLNSGTGQFTELPNAFSLDAASWWPTDAAAGDVDGDGLPDLVITGMGQTNVFLNRGARFLEHQKLVEVWPMACDLGDFDRDGDLDLLTCTGTGFGSGVPCKLFENDGAGTFVNVSSRLPGAGTTLNLGGFVDADLDGDLDLVAQYAGPYPGQQQTQLVNDGEGRFFDASATTMPTFAGRVLVGAFVFADLDGDGDPDLTINNRPSGLRHLVLYNLHRHLYPPAPPQLGGTYAVELWGRPGDRMIPIVSAAPASIPFTPFGSLWVAPVGSVLGVPQTVPAQGPATFRLPVPNDPGLVGAGLYLQAFALDRTDPARSHLTNAFVDTIVP